MLRRDVIMLGWDEAMLRDIDLVIHKMLPTLAEVLRDEARWDKLGVVVPSGLSSMSEVGVLQLVRPKPPPGDSKVTTQVRQQADAPQLTKSPQSDRPGARDTLDGEMSEIEDEAWKMVPFATPSEEIWERHGWDRMQGWRAW